MNLDSLTQRYAPKSANHFNTVIEFEIKEIAIEIGGKNYFGKKVLLYLNSLHFFLEFKVYDRFKQLLCEFENLT